MRAYAMVQRPASTYQDPLGQFQPNFAGNMPGGWGFRFIQIKGLAPFGAQ